MGRVSERVEKRNMQRKKERERCLFPFWIYLQEKNYSWLLHSSGIPNWYEGEKTTAAKLWNCDAVLFINRIQHTDSAAPLNSHTLWAFSVSQTDDWSYLTVRFMTPYYTATVNRSGLCLFLRAFVSLLSCLPAPLTVLRAVCCLCRCFYAIYFSKFQLENPLWSSVWVKSCLNSYLSSQKPTVEEQSPFHWIDWMR